MGNEFVCAAPLALLLLALCTCYIHSTKVRTVTEAVGAFLLFFLFLGCREITVINDTFFNYCLQEQLLNLDPAARWAEMHSHEKMMLYGPLYHLYMLLLSLLWPSPYVVVVASSAIGAGVAMWLVKKLSPIPALTAFILWLPVIQVESTFRQTLAVALFFIALYQLVMHRRLWLYLALTVVAALIHKSALVLLPLPLLLRLKFNLKNAAIALGAFAVAGLLVYKLAYLCGFGEHVYVQKSLDRLFYPGAFLFAVIMGALTWWTYTLSRRCSAQIDQVTAALLWCGLLCTGCYLLGARISELHRLGWYFTIPAVLGMVRVASTAVRRCLPGGNLLIAVAALAFYGYYVMACLWRPEWYNLVPYNFIFQ